jgi:hypothetical protein
MAELSFAMTLVQHCHSGKLAVAVPGKARPASAERRLERYLANDRIDPDAVWSHLTSSFLAGWTGGSLVLILDETPNHNDLRCLKVTLAFRKRALPLGCACYRLGEQPEPMPELVVDPLRRVAACLTEGADVTLLADRGLAWPQVGDACHELGWHYVLRLLSQTRVRTPEGRECSVAELAPRPGTCWRGEARPVYSISRVGGPPRSPPVGCRSATGRGSWSATGTTARRRRIRKPRCGRVRRYRPRRWP